MPILEFPAVAVGLSTYGGSYSPFGTETVSPTTASSATVLSPPGFWMVKTGPHTTVAYSPDGGVTYRTLITTNSGGLVYSDGVSVEILNDVTGGTAFYEQILGNA